MSDVKEITPINLMLFGIIGGLVGIYVTPIFPPYTSIFGALGAICAVIWSAEAVRRVAKYGLGTGVPSIGQIAMGMGIIAAMFGLAMVKSMPLAGPILALITASVIGFIIGWFAQNVIKMKIPVMIRCMTEIAAAGALIIIGFSASVAGNYDFVGSFIPLVFDNGVILAVFWVGAVAMLHPFNACLGPDEKQKRLLYLAGSTGAITMALMGIAAIMTLGIMGAVTLVIGVILWLIFYKKFWDEVYNDAAAVVGTGLIPKTEA
ncbi:MAG: tetrahydromethanopterin S-methyltransferase subunit C [Candidatus Methanoperedens sp.]|nr:tetrahydromethanopterin S-methyltransferase subunit C [Candidatus Methanoperedens sp.]MCZ7404598.1 tetrahydromethanopterin S-methyltransferase subunit C [Candidatus Methanoperedens sp.]